MIVGLGAGVSFVRCCHMNKVEVAQITDMPHGESAPHNDCDAECDAADHCVGIPASHCMAVTVVKLAPSNIAQHPSFNFNDFPQIVSLFNEIFSYWSLSTTVDTAIQYVYNKFHSPPREYLALIRVLII